MCMFVVVVMVSAACADSITIAKDNAPVMTVVIPVEADEQVERAANELQEYVTKLVGVELPIVTDEADLDAPAIFVGPCRQVEKHELPPAGANLESYAVRVRDGNLILVGRQWYGTEFAVYSFLEDNLGIRWFVPGPLGECLPKHKQGELVVDVKPRVVQPDFSPRVWSGNDFFPEWGRWNRHNKVSLTGALPWRQFQNNIFRVFPPEKYADEHPEYYPLINGKRWIPGPKAGSYWRPCESNPEVINATVEYARSWFDAHPEANGFSVGMDDISHLCQCEHCIAHDPDPEAYKRGEYSDRHYWFVNTLARALAKTNPDKYIGTLIYNIARKPPTTIDTLEPNVFGYITQCEAEWWREGLRDEDMALTKEWRRRCQHLCRYTYWGLGWVTPRYFPHYMAEALKFDHDLGFHGIYVEVYTNWPNTGPMIWAASKLFWNASLDIDGLLDEFMEGMFLEAAPQMKAYYDFLEQTWMGGNPCRTTWGHRRVPTQACSMTVEQLDKCERLLGAALAKATTPLVKQRIEMVGRGLRYGSFLIRAQELSSALNAAAVVDEASAKAAIATVNKMRKVVSERKQYWSEMLEGDDLAAQNFQALNNFYFKGHVPAEQVQGGLAAGVAKVLGWYEQNAPGRLGEVTQAFRGEADDEVAALLDAWSYVAREKPENLLANPSFEQSGENQQQAEMDWVTTGAPTGWSTWHRADRDTRFEATAEGHDGKLAASIADASSAAYLQSVKVAEGERYLCQLWAKREPADGTGTVQLGVRWRTPEGSWYPDSSHDRSVQLQSGLEGWQPLYVLAEAPEDASTLVFMCSTSGQQEGTVAVFDDGAVYRIPR